MGTHRGNVELPSKIISGNTNVSIISISKKHKLYYIWRTELITTSIVISYFYWWEELFYKYNAKRNVLLIANFFVPYLKGHSGAEWHIYFLVHLESIYYQIFFYSKIVPNCAVAKWLFEPEMYRWLVRSWNFRFFHEFFPHSISLVEWQIPY